MAKSWAGGMDDVFIVLHDSAVNGNMFFEFPCITLPAACVRRSPNRANRAAVTL